MKEGMGVEVQVGEFLNRDAMNDRTSAAHRGETAQPRTKKRSQNLVSVSSRSAQLSNRSKVCGSMQMRPRVAPPKLRKKTTPWEHSSHAKTAPDFET
jgi:hypothetical protein